MSAPTNTPPPVPSPQSLPPGGALLPVGSELERAFAESVDQVDHSDDPTLHDAMEDGDEGHVKKKKRAPHKEQSIKELNLTAMMDMMTIILVFLLKNYATQPENITLSERLQPPKSITDVKLETALPITITKDAILVDNKEIVKVQAGKVLGEPADYTATMINDVKTVLDDQVAKIRAVGSGGGTQFEGKVLIICDGDVPYALLMRVLYTAGQSDFTQYKLITRARAPNETVGAP